MRAKRFPSIKNERLNEALRSKSETGLCEFTDQSLLNPSRVILFTADASLLSNLLP